MLFSSLKLNEHSVNSKFRELSVKFTIAGIVKDSWVPGTRKELLLELVKHLKKRKTQSIAVRLLKIALSLWL